MGLWNRETREETWAKDDKATYDKILAELHNKHQQQIVADLNQLEEDMATSPDLLCVQPDGTVQPVISLRDQFAMAALQGMLANSHPNSEDKDYPIYGALNELFVAKQAYDFADGMLKAREGKA